MEPIQIRMPKSIYSADSIAQTCHRYTGRLYVSIDSDGEDWLISMRPKDSEDAHELISQDFQNDALDDVLRVKIRERTAGLAEMLLSTALRHSGMPE